MLNMIVLNMTVLNIAVLNIAVLNMTVLNIAALNMAVLNMAVLNCQEYSRLLQNIRQGELGWMAIAVSINVIYCMEDGCWWLENLNLLFW